MINTDELIIGRLYKLHCRNLRTGVYHGEGFTGIRLKFGHHYLDIEYPNHTVKEAIDMGVDCPLEPYAFWWIDGKHVENKELYEWLLDYDHDCLRPPDEEWKHGIWHAESWTWSRKRA